MSGAGATRARDALFARFLGESFGALPQAVRDGHMIGDGLRLSGRARVTRGPTPWARLIAAVFGFPKASDEVEVVVTMRPKDGGELWERRFAGKPFWSFLKVREGRMTERFGPLTFTLDLHVADGRLHYPVLAGRAGPLPLPRWMLPVSVASEYAKDGRFHFDVRLKAPLTGALIVHYEGWLVPDLGQPV